MKKLLVAILVVSSLSACAPIVVQPQPYQIYQPHYHFKGYGYYGNPYPYYYRHY